MQSASEKTSRRSTLWSCPTVTTTTAAGFAHSYIDITKVEHPDWPDLKTMLSGDMYGYMMLCTHPTREGHKWIANKVLKAI